jgi:hypothetical protein
MCITLVLMVSLLYVYIYIPHVDFSDFCMPVSPVLP